MTQNEGLHHLHVRKRVHEKKEKYPHPEEFKRKYDKFMYAIAILCPIMFLPQMLKVWISQDASGISIVSWISFAVIACFWTYYGILHKERQLIIMNGALVIIQLMTAIGAIIY
jgi:uncharacterized protein with PQ loop repeat